MSAKRLLAVAVLGAAVFSASFALAGPSPREALDRALATVASDTAQRVCLGPGECLSPRAEQTLFVFFSMADCPAGLYDTAVLDELFRATPREQLNVVGVVSGMTRDEAAKFALASGISYPLYLDAERMERHLGNPRPPLTNRPVKVLVDSTGALVERWPSRVTVSGNRAEMERVRRRIGDG